MGTTISGDTGITFPDATTQSKAVSQATPFAVTASATTGAQISLPEGTNNGANFVALKAADTLAANTTFTLPAADGTNGQFLQTNGSGALAFASVPPSNTFNAIASGTLTNGSTVIVNVDGTVSVVSPVITPVPSAGASVLLNNASTSLISATYDSINQKVVIAYADSSLGYAAVGTVSGNTITFGTRVAFNSAATTNSVTACAYDSNAQKIVIIYNDVTNSAGYAIVGTVSGTSISFGTAVLFQGVNGIGASAQVVYDSILQKVVVVFMDASNNSGKARVGTVSGTSISFGTVAQFAASISDISAAYDTNAQKIVISYRNGSGFGAAVIGTVSGTSISYGAEVTFNAASTFGTATTYNENAQKVVIAYYNAGNSNFGTAIVGTVSGTSISFGTAVVFQSTSTSAISAVYDASVQKVVLTYIDGTTTFGNAIVGTVSGTSISFSAPVVFQSVATQSTASTYNALAQRIVTAYRVTTGGLGRGVVISSTTSTPNLTSENFIGFSSAAYDNGQTATIQLVGAVNSAQSGLTPGQSYFVQTNGTLGLTADNPSVFAGTAVAANKIIVKG